MGNGTIIGIFLILIFSIILTQSAFAFEYNPLPLVKLRESISQKDFLSKTQDELLKDVWHSTLVRENGEKVDVYLTYSGYAGADFVAIFYFEDNTNDDFEEDYYFKNDLFVFDVNPDLEGDVRLAISAERFGTTCIKNIFGEEGFFSYFYEGKCESGTVLTKETENGWAGYVNLFYDLKLPSQEKPYHIKFAYVDAKQVDDNGFDQSEIYFLPEYFIGFATAIPTVEIVPEKLLVNSGEMRINDFLYMPTDLFTESLSRNVFPCADDTIKVSTDQEKYELDELAKITVEIKSIETEIEVYLRIYDENKIVVLKKSAGFGGNEVRFFFYLDDFTPGIYTASVQFGIDGSKDEIKFGVGTEKQIEQEKKNECELYLLYDDQKSSLFVFARLYDPSGTSIDSFQIFLDRKGDGHLNLDEDDIRYHITKTDFGGRKILAEGGWLTGDDYKESGTARINKVYDGFEILVEFPNVSKNFRLATEQSDLTFIELKKERNPPNSFSTIPITWAQTKFVDNSPIRYKAENWIPDEIITNQNMDVNLILVGDEWTDSQKNKIKTKLDKSRQPLIHSELHLAGMEFNYFYNFVSAPQQVSDDLFALMKENAEHVNPFFGEEEYDYPWGIASWIKTNHTEWVSLTQQRYEIDYKLIDAQLVEEFLYENLIAKDPNLSKPNSANLIFIADDMEKVDFLHNYKLTTDDPSTKKRHKEIGLMGYGGKYNTYFFDLYAVPWDQWQGISGFYDENLINQYTNFHDLKTEEEQAQLLADYTNNATSLIISPSYVYPPVYKSHYVIDLVIVTEPSSTANSVLIDRFINEEKIISELERLVPNSTWELKLILERSTSRDLPTSVKDVLKSAKKVPLFSEDFGPVISVLDSKDVTKQLVAWASTRESSGFDDFRDVKESLWVIPVIVMIGEGSNQWYIDNYGVIGLAAAHPDDETQPCCAIGLWNDYAVWEDKVGLTDLVIHEVGHIVGLMHPFQGYDTEYEIFQNNYFNWYGSPMGYHSPPRGCGIWYWFHVDEPCGNADAHFTYFEKDAISKGIATYLIKSAENNIYRTILELEKSGMDPVNISEDVKSDIQNIESKIKQAKSAFKLNNLHSENGAIAIAYAATVESQDLAEEKGVTYKTLLDSEVEIVIPSWIKQQVGWWVNSETQDSDFINSMQYLIKERIILLPYIPESSFTSEDIEIPPWIKNNAGWWAQGQVSDQEFASAMQYLIKEGVLRIG